MKAPFYLIPLLPMAHAWTFLYTNSTDQSTILHEDKALKCTKIDLSGVKHFSWDPEGDNLCISIYYDDSCGSRGGISCPIWKKNASTDFRSIELFTDEEAVSASVSKLTATSTSTTASSSSSPTSSSAATTTPTTSPTNSPAPGNNSSSSSGISGGAIAGIVIGAVAGIGAIAGLFFYFGKKHRKAANKQTPPAPGLYGPENSMYGPTTAFDPVSPSGASEKPPYSASGVSSRPPVELDGYHHTVELANSPLSEMDSNSGGKSYFARSG